MDLKAILWIWDRFWHCTGLLCPQRTHPTLLWTKSCIAHQWSKIWNISHILRVNDQHHIWHLWGKIINTFCTLSQCCFEQNGHQEFKIQHLRGKINVIFEEQAEVCLCDSEAKSNCWSIQVQHLLKLVWLLLLVFLSDYDIKRTQMNWVFLTMHVSD